jgi:hypothetical protein
MTQRVGALLLCMTLSLAGAYGAHSPASAIQAQQSRVRTLLGALSEEQRREAQKGGVPRADSVAGSIVGSAVDAELAHLEDGTPFTVMRIHVAKPKDQDVIAVCLGELAGPCVATNHKRVRLDFTLSSFSNPNDDSFGLALVLGTKITAPR